MGEGVVLWPVFVSHGDDRSTFFLKFSVLGFFGNKPFFAVTLFKYSKYSFFFSVYFTFQGSSPSLGIWSSLPVEYFEGKKSCFTQPRRCLKQKYKKEGCFYCVESICCQKEMWKTVLKLLTTATKISWQYELTDAFLSVAGGVQGDPPVSRYGRLTILARLTFLHSGWPS